MAGRTTWFDTLVHLFFRNVLTGVGAGLATISFGAIAVLTGAELTGAIESPYLGILTFILLPAIFLFGLILIPIGIWFERRRAHKTGAIAPHEFPKIDLNNPQTRRTMFLVVFLTGVNLFVVSAATYKGSVYMESPQFCGQVCHTIMEPEYTAYLESPHAVVHCVECHYGPGAQGYVDAKMGGLRQLAHMVQGTYSKPVPAPVANMDWANVTCLECHWPGKYIGDRMHLRKKYAEDETNTELSTVFITHVGGGDSEVGIHSYHMNSKRNITYYFADEKREEIPYVKVTDPDGTVTEYIMDGAEIDPANLDPKSMRHMDCLDCHNRPSHNFKLPETAVDDYLAKGEIARDLPYVKSAAVETLRGAADTEDGLAHIAEHLPAYYAENYPDLVEPRKADIDAAVASLQAIFKRNVFPKMNVTWGTYENHIGHTLSTGCFRCHDDSHVSSDSRKISQDCTVCHNVLAWDEENPDILATLGL